MRPLIAALVVFLPVSAWAECAPLDADDRQMQLAPHYLELRNSASEFHARAPVSAIWKVWMTAPDAKAQGMLDGGLGRMRQSDFDSAIQRLSELTAYCPNYAEGWNQLAFARYLSGDYDGALSDLDRAIELAPNHFAALAGKGLTLLHQGRTVLGHQAIREALRYHPWISERHLLPPSEKT